ncbi:signal peptidase I [Marinimicrobium koreense]|nr:signal peptidase I [Marinimicrobium koreense]
MRKTLLLMIVTLFSASASGREFVQTGSSMEPTIKDGQKIEVGILSSFSYDPKRWDLVALKNPQDFNLLVFRIIGLPNETIRLEKEGIHINDEMIKIPMELVQAGVYYWPASAITNNENYSDNLYRTKEGEYFLLGDNTLNANDSRFQLGIIHRDSILNKVEGSL